MFYQEKKVSMEIAKWSDYLDTKATHKESYLCGGKLVPGVVMEVVHIHLQSLPLSDLHT